MLGAAMVAGGVVVLVRLFAQFVTDGLGTPAPIAPTRYLVVSGLYRHVRNPMYVAVVAAIVGQALLLGRADLIGYAVIVWVVVAAFVRWHEEPSLHERFAASYDEYRDAVPAWRPRLRPWTPTRDVHQDSEAAVGTVTERS
jgi:protein-S-isoprenylcysteine O-methyltransferase Ste14